MPSEELLKRKKHLKSLEEFLGGPAYAGFLAGIEEEIRQLEGIILETFPVDVEDVYRQCGLRGQIECLCTMLERFTGAAEELKDRIDDLENEEVASRKAG